MINIKTYLRQYKNDTAGIVWISFYVQRQKVNFSTKVAVSLKNWNDKKGIVTSGDKQAADKNLIIETILARINNVFVKYRLRDKKLSRDLFLREYNRPSDYPTFFDFVREHMKKISHRTELTTLQPAERPSGCPLSAPYRCLKNSAPAGQKTGKDWLSPLRSGSDRTCRPPRSTGHPERRRDASPHWESQLFGRTSDRPAHTHPR